jgi:large subunit ribosomal protein L2
LLSKMSKAYIGKNENFRINDLVEGKWGFGFHNKKKINVRGVAMNPVDHPNGGRTKTVQPEKSPWNWIAKKKK